MTALNLSTDIPSQIDTLERLHAYTALALHNLYKGITYKEAQGTQLDSGLAPLVDISFINAADGTSRMLTRSAIEVDPAYITDTSQKLWMFADELGVTVLPAAFKVD